MMLFNKKLTSQEALDCGLVTRLFNHDNFEEEVSKQVKEMASLPVNVSFTLNNFLFKLSFLKSYKVYNKCDILYMTY